MNMLPCTKCPNPKCGLVNQCTETKCECGMDLSRCSVIMTDISKLTHMELGKISRDKAVYGQICPCCGNVVYTVSPRLRKTLCPGCGSERIAAFRPIHYLDIP